VVMNIAVRADPISYQLSQVNGIITTFKIHWFKRFKTWSDIFWKSFKHLHRPTALTCF
jgi:hypothetical protein